MRPLRRAAAAGCVLAAAAFAANALGLTVEAVQVEGRVTDESGSALPGVTVEIRGAALASAKVVATDAAGAYRVAGLPPSSYEVQFRLGSPSKWRFGFFLFASIGK